MKPVCVAVALLIVAAGAAAAAEKPPTVASIYKAAKEYFERGELREAREMWVGLLELRKQELSPEQVKALEGRVAQADVQIGELERPSREALAQAASAVTTADPLLAGPEEQRARGLESLKVARAHLAKVEDPVSTELAALYLRAFCAAYLDPVDKAAAAVEEAGEAMPKDPGPLNLRAELARRSGDKAAARKLLLASLRIDDEQLEVHYRLARLLIEEDPRDPAALRHAVASVGRDKERARELAGLFEDQEPKDKLEAIALELAIKSAQRDVDEEQRRKAHLTTGIIPGMGGVGRRFRQGGDDQSLTEQIKLDK